MTVYDVPVSHILLLRSYLLADSHAFFTTGMELTAFRRICRRRNASFQDDSIHLRFRIRNRNRGEQSLRIRMQRFSKEILRVAKLYDIPEIHYSDRIGDMLYDG